MRIYLAGGAVRDLLLGRPIHDRDYLVMESTSQQFEKQFPNAQLVGRTFPVYLLNRLEFSFPRGQSITEELESRDLTVNAMLLDEDGNLFCHPQSLDDLHDKVLRPTSQQAFFDDPLRVFRAARFWAKFPDFTPHPELIEVMRSVAHEGLLSTIFADRIGQETVKAISSDMPGNYLRLLAESNCLKPWLEEFSSGLNIPAGPLPYHDTHVIEHTARTMDSLAGKPTEVWMGFCHDIGKNMTPEEHHPKHYNHDVLGEKMADKLTQRLRMANAFAIAGRKAARWHMIAARYDELRPGSKVDLLMDLHFAKVTESLFRLVKIDQEKDFLSRALRDQRIILKISLQAKDMNLGPESGKRLRELRAGALAKKR